MDGYTQTAIGIFVSIVLFLLGYRQTIGAKKEREKAANTSVHRAIMRRMVLEDYQPSLADISRILEGKAREFQVSSLNLLSEDQVLNQLYTAIFDNDLIAPPQRVELEKRLDHVFNEMYQVENGNTNKSSDIEFISKDHRERIITVMAVTTSGLGSISVFFYKTLGQLEPIDINILASMAGVFIASLGIIISLLAIRKSRDTSDEPSKISSINEGVALEKEIADILDKLNIEYATGIVGAGLQTDFIAVVGNKKIALEAKAWRNPPPPRYLRRIREILMKIIKDGAADEGLIVTKDSIRFPLQAIENQSIEIVHVRRLRSYLEKKLKPSIS